MIRNKYLRKTEAILRRLDDEIDQLAWKSKKASDGAREIYDEQIEILRAKAETARARIRDVRGAGASAWGNLRKGVDFALQDLGNALENAVARLRRTGSDGR